MSEDLGTAIDGAAVKRLIKRRRARDRVFGTELFGDPAWDMLLDLAAAHAEDRELSVTSLCLATPTPATTALRWLDRLVSSGLVARQADPKDRRRVLVRLTEPAARRMALCLRRIDES